MDISHDLITQLTELSGALDGNGSDLTAMLAVLVDDLAAAVPSFLGLTMTLPQQSPAPSAANPVILNVLPPSLAGEVGATLLVPLKALGVPHPGGTVVFYARQPGAFVDLAADTQFAYHLDGQVTLDQHLPPTNHPARASGVFGHTEASTVNRAIGVLIDRGHTPEKARSILQQRADQDGIPLHRVAQQLVPTPMVDRGAIA